MSTTAKGHFESDTTLFLRTLENQAVNNQSPARAAEQVKYERINKLRDVVQPATGADKIWKGF